MKFLIELDTVDDGAKSQSEWALWLLKCICSYLKPEGVTTISVTPAEPVGGGLVQ